MPLPFSLFLALRFLKPKRTFLSIITIISVLGVTLGIAVMILVISVMTGFDKELRDKVMGFDPHVSVTDASGFLSAWREPLALLQKRPEVTAAAPFVEGHLLVANTTVGRVQPGLYRGIDPRSDGNAPSLRRSILEGAFSLSGDSALLGKDFAEALQIRVGDKITVYPARDFNPVIEAIQEAEKAANPKDSLAKIRDLVLPKELTVQGIFSSGVYKYDSGIVLVPIDIAQELCGVRDEVQGISLWMPRPQDAAELSKTLNRALPGNLRATAWMHESANKQLLDAIQVERTTMFFLLLFIVIVAAFSIMNTLITVTVMKTREIGILKALGANKLQIVWVFLTQGMIVGVFGNLAGLGLGLGLIHWRNDFKDWLASQLHIEIFPPGIYQFSKIPAEVIPSWVALICLSAFCICSVAALIPAWVASRLEPVEALRHD